MFVCLLGILFYMTLKNSDLGFTVAKNTYFKFCLKIIFYNIFFLCLSNALLKDMKSKIRKILATKLYSL